MEKDEAIACLKQHEPELKQLGVERLFLFGSGGRNEVARIRMSTFSSTLKKAVLIYSTSWT